MRAFFDAGQKQFPDSAAQQPAHRIHPAIPAVEVAHHADALRIWRPDCKVNASLFADSAQMRAELFIDFPVLSLGEEMQVDLTHNRAVLIRITRQLLRAIPRREAKMIIEVAHRAGHTRAKKTVAMKSISGDRLSRWSIQNDVDLFCVRPKHADLQIIANAVWSQNAEWIRMSPGEKTVQFIGWQSRDFERSHASIT